LGLAVLFSKKPIPAESRMVQQSAIFTAVIAVLPLLLIFDGQVSRIDGIILLLAFAIYSWWIFSKEERFKKVYFKTTKKIKSKSLEFTIFLKNIAKLIIILVLLLAASQVVIDTANFFANAFGISLALIGILIIGLGNCFPEAYFSIISAKKKQGWMILGDLLGSVIMCSTLV
jgi:cation:H+ antiporter